MEYKKNIVLVASDSNANQKAVLSYIKENNQYFFEFKGINFQDKDRILGVYINNKKLYKYDLGTRNLSFTINQNNNEQIKNVSAVVLDRQNMLKPFLWGTQLLSEDNFILNKVIEEINIKTMNENIENIDKDDNIKEDKKENFSFVKNLSVNDTYNQYDEDERQKELDKEEKELNDLLDDYQDEINEDFNKIEDLPEFYAKISNQIEKMLKDNETENILEDIIPDSKFVRIPKGNGESYVFGIIYENNQPKYLCYGERGKYSEERPEHLKDYYQWLPIDVDNISGDGYFMMYQDAKTGKNLEMTII